jgi:hypothetical protein
MRNRIPKVKKIKIIKEDEEDNDYDGRITLIKSDNPNFTYEVYDFKTGVFRGFMGNRNFKKEESNG